MITLPVAERENGRVDMVRSFGLIDRPTATLHDEAAALARELGNVATSLVSLVDSHRNWFSGIANFSDVDQCRWSSFCTHVVADPKQPMWIEDARLDFRFRENRYVVSDPHLRFYVGVPIIVNGYAVGSFCIFDSQPRAYDEELLQRLVRLSKIVADDLASRHRERVLQQSLEASADALINCDDSGVITDWSEGAERLFGFKASEALGRNVSMLCPPDKVAAHARGFSHWKISGEGRLDRRVELNAQRKDGSHVDIELWMSVAHVNGVRHIHSNIRDISDRRRQSAELLAAKSDAEAANAAKSTFLANMSHELRTPLNGVIAVTDLLAKTSLSPHQTELTSLIQSSSNQLRRLVGDILDLSRIESGELVLAESSMSVVEIVDDVVRLSALGAEAKGLALRTTIAPDVAGAVLGDALKLKQVLTNLISNAVKFTESGMVEVRVSRSESIYRFDVSDTGIGFSEEQRSLIFERFQQADGSITRKFGGTGLGLAISRQLVAIMGGRLECRATPGKGADFWFSVPFKTSLTSCVEEGPAQEANLDVTTVLVVDDNATNRRVAELLLNSIGAQVISVEDGEQAVSAFMQGRYDVILMDMMMPVMDGIAATRAIRQLEVDQCLHRTPIAMLTANTLPEHTAKSLDAGADLHLSKPINATELVQALQFLIGDNEPVPSH